MWYLGRPCPPVLHNNNEKPYVKRVAPTLILGTYYVLAVTAGSQAKGGRCWTGRDERSIDLDTLGTLQLNTTVPSTNHGRAVAVRRHLHMPITSVEIPARCTVHETRRERRGRRGRSKWRGGGSRWPRRGEQQRRDDRPCRLPVPAAS